MTETNPHVVIQSDGQHPLACLPPATITVSPLATAASNLAEDCRTVPAPTAVMDVLIEHLARYRPDAGREDLVFTNNRGGHILRRNFSRDALRPAVIRAGLAGRRVTWLTVRHTGASLTFDPGLTLFEVQQRLGHKSPTLTANIYTHLMRERFEEGREKLENYMREKRSAAPPSHTQITQLELG